MNNAAKLGAGVAGGYLLGRTKKLKLAIGLGAWLMGKRLQISPTQLAMQGLGQLRESPEFADLTDRMRGELGGAGKRALAAAATSRMDSLAERLSDRNRQLEGGGEEDEYDEDEDFEGEEDEYDEDQDEDEGEDTDDVEDEYDDEEEDVDEDEEDGQEDDLDDEDEPRAEDEEYDDEDEDTDEDDDAPRDEEDEFDDEDEDEDDDAGPADDAAEDEPYPDEAPRRQRAGARNGNRRSSSARRR